MKRKKILSWLLAFSMVLSLFLSMPITAYAESYVSGNAVGFNSSENSYITVPDSNSLDVTNELTFEAWIKPSAGGGEWALIAGKQLNPSDGNPWYSYRLLAASTNSGEKGFPRKVAFQIAPEESGETGVQSNTVVQNDVWTHVAGVYDGTSVKIYINGVLENSNLVTGNIQVSDLSLYIGKAPWTNYNNYNGLIDEIRVWNVARTAEQISYGMQHTLTGNETGLAGYWKFDEASGTTTADAISNNNDGNLYNEAYFTASGVPVTSPYDGEYNIEADSIIISADGDYRIYGTGTSTANTIVVNTGVTANIMLDSVNINVSGTSEACAFDIQGTAQVNVVLAAGSENTLCSGIDKAGLQVADAAQLIIDAETGNAGALYAYGGNYAAGIGGAYGYSGGTIIIEDGIINANASYGSGSGIGSGLYGDGCNITINGGSIIANGSGSGAGIGSGEDGDVGSIHIHGGTIIASSTGNEDFYEGGSGIGSGDDGYNGEIFIDGGTITANGKYDCPGIGGCYGSTGTITIRGASTTVTASSGLYAAAIGGGYGNGGGVINIEGGTITAKGRYRSPGIGDYDDGTTVINISGGTVVSNGGENACGIGSGYHSEYNPLPILNFSGGSLSVSHGAGASYDINAVMNTSEGEGFSTGGCLVPSSGQIISITGQVTGVFTYNLNGIAVNETVIFATKKSASGYFMLYPLETGMQIIRQDDNLSWKYLADAVQPQLTAGAADRKSDSVADITFTCSKFAGFFYQVTADGAAIPEIDTSGSGNYCDGESKLNLDCLTAGAWDIYLVAKDMAGNEGEMIKIDIDAFTEDVCKIEDTYYTKLSDALAIVIDGETITLLQDIEYASGISISGKDITFDLNGFDLNVNFTATIMGWNALFVDNGSVSLDKTNGGEFNVTCNGKTNNVDCYGVYMGQNSSAEVSNVTAIQGYGIFNNSGGTVTVSGDVQADFNGVFTNGGTVNVFEDVQAGFHGIYSIGGTVTVGGNVQGNYGVYAQNNAVVTVDGNAIGNENNGAYATGEMTAITIGGNVSSGRSAGAYADSGASISIAGRVSGDEDGICSIGTGSSIYVAKDVTSNDNGVWVINGEVTIDGTIIATNTYIKIYVEFFELDDGLVGTGEYSNYLIYSGTSGGVVRVKNPGTELSNDATLSNLSASGITLAPKFDSATTSYTANVNNSIISTTISAITSDNSATIKINGTEVSSKLISLSVGSNVITVEVTAEDGTTNKTYTITIDRADISPPPNSSGGSRTPSKYQISAAANTGGTITPLGNSIMTEYGSITFTIKPDKGYIVKDVLIDEVSVGAVTTYTFSSVKANHTIEAKFVHDCPSKPFTDVDITQWYHDGIDYVLLAGLFKGTSATTFAPNAGMTRAMLVTVLHRLEGTPSTTIDNPFTDVASGNWYTEAIMWANAKGIVKGYDSDTFGTNDFITREQLAAILYRYAQYKGYDVSVGEDTNILSYEDALKISEYAIPAIQWACGAGIMQGDGAKLDPQGNATRAQVATMLMRFIENVVK